MLDRPMPRREIPFRHSLLVMLLVFTVPLVAKAQSVPLAGEAPDYLLPSSLPAQRTDTVRQQAKALGQGERVSYKAFSGQTYTLTRVTGRHVALLLPDSWVAAYSDEQLRTFADRTDLIYQHLKDLLGVEPEGEGLLTAAIVPDACALGCALLGLKGVEVHESALDAFRQEVVLDFPLTVLIHEMTHNFDVFWEYLASAWDYPHAWTDFIGYYYHLYSGDGWTERTPSEVIHNHLTFAQRYFLNPEADWETCVRDGRCEDQGIVSSQAAGGLGLRLALLHGPQAVRGFTGFLRAYRQAHPPPETPEERNDLYIEALAAGARRNLGCVVDAWRWPISDALRQRMQRLYGANPDCQDRDLDGATPLTGDCDERRASIHPGAAEKRNRIDDDCDGRVDEATLREPPGSDFGARRQLSLPTDVAGIADFDGDEFGFHLTSDSRVRIQACSMETAGVVAWLSDSSGVRRGNASGFGPICEQEPFTLSAGDWIVNVTANGADDVEYLLALETTLGWPPAPWARTAPPRRQGNRFLLTAVPAAGRPPGQPAEIRFWVSGFGIVGTRPYSRAVEFAWTPPAGVDPEAEALSYRVQLLVKGVPAAALTPVQPFGEP